MPELVVADAAWLQHLEMHVGLVGEVERRQQQQRLLGEPLVVVALGFAQTPCFAGLVIELGETPVAMSHFASRADL